MVGEIAQTVEQRPEKPCVPSSILGFATIFLHLKTLLDYALWIIFYIFISKFYLSKEFSFTMKRDRN